MAEINLTLSMLPSPSTMNESAYESNQRSASCEECYKSYNSLTRPVGHRDCGDDWMFEKERSTEGNGDRGMSNSKGDWVDEVGTESKCADVDNTPSR
jgi:hypothetical protein